MEASPYSSRRRFPQEESFRSLINPLSISVSSPRATDPNTATERPRFARTMARISSPFAPSSSRSGFLAASDMAVSLHKRRSCVRRTSAASRLITHDQVTVPLRTTTGIKPGVQLQPTTRTQAHHLDAKPHFRGLQRTQRTNRAGLLVRWLWVRAPHGPLNTTDQMSHCRGAVSRESRGIRRILSRTILQSQRIRHVVATTTPANIAARQYTMADRICSKERLKEMKLIASTAYASVAA